MAEEQNAPATSKGLLIGLVVLLALLIAAVVYVKKDSTAKAKAYATAEDQKLSESKSRVKALLENNQAVWSVVTEALQGDDRTLASVEALARAKRLNGKDGTEGAPLEVAVTAAGANKILTFGWEKYKASFTFDGKGAFVSVDLTALMKVEDPALDPNPDYVQASKK